METAAKIMVVDDEKRICENVAKILTRNNFTVVHAQSAEEALEKMARDAFSLVISDIVMPGMNGLELLRLIKENWPLTKAVMMTAYAATDTAVSAIRLGALDYLSKPFTPNELRTTVEKALSGELSEVKTTARERAAVPIDVDIPFDRQDVAEAAGQDYVDMLGPSDMPVVEVRLPENLENYCEVGAMVCDIFKKLGATCKAGTKSQECPRQAKEKRAAELKSATDVKSLIGIDQPFNYQEVAAVTGPEYLHNLGAGGLSFLPYETLKQRVSEKAPGKRDVIDVDIPFDREAVAEVAGEAYADRLSRSDMPAIEITSSRPPENFCEVGGMVCDIFKKLGATCKVGTKSQECPRQAKEKRAAAAAFDARRLIGVDMPFDYDEVAAATGPGYVQALVREDTLQVPYEELKDRISRIEAATARTAGDVLVIDDEVTVNRNIRKILSKNNFQVDQAVTLNEALERISRRTYRLILLDLRIPGVTGLDLLAAIGREQPDARVIIITGYASIETAVECARMGAVAYLPKPFTPNEIRSAAESALRLAA